MAEVLRNKGSLFCVQHPKNKLIVFCDQCNILICSKCMLGKHSGHQGTEIEDIAEDKFKNIDDFITKTESQTIPDLKQNFCQVEAQVNASVKVLQSGVEEAYEREKHLIELVKNNTKETITQLKSEIKSINQQFSQFKTDSGNLLGKLKAAVNECKQTKRSDNDILMIDVAEEVQELDKIKLKNPNIQTSKFLPGSNTAEFIKKAFGYIKQEGISKDKLDQPKNALSLARTDDSSNKTKHLEIGQTSKPSTGSDQLNQLVTDRNPIAQPTMTKSIDLDLQPHSLKIFNNGTVCICGGKSYLKLLNANGDIKQVNLDMLINDIDIHPTNDDIYGATGDKTVRKIDIHTGKSSHLFMTKHTSYCIAFCKDNKMLVGSTYKDEITVYTINGEILQDITVTTPMHITVSPVTGDVAIACGFNGTYVFNKDFQHSCMFRYQGSGQHKPTLNARFDSHYAVFDNQGHLLIGDQHNKEVHICEANAGKLLKTINLTKYGYIKSLALLPDRTLVVGTCAPNKLVYVKYI